MQRRATILVVVLALLLTACTGSRGRAPTPVRADRPNIVFVLTDDLSMNLISRMPHVRALQRAGTTMSKYYVVDSLCCPSRAAIFTGQYPHDNGVYRNAGADGGYAAYNRHGNEQRSFAVALHDAGYRTALMGKYLNGYRPDDPVPPGYDEWDVTGSGYREYQYTLNHDGVPEPHGNQPQDYLVDVLSEAGADFIKRSAADRKPFMLQVATFAPHAPYVAAPRYANAFPHVAYPRTAAYDTLPDLPPAWLAARAPLTTDQQSMIDEAYRQRLRADLAVDDLIANLSRTLRDEGVAGNTYFVFSSDNGYHMGENRLSPGKQTAFDTDIHVPLVVSGPKVPVGKTVDLLASNIDLAPTFESIARTPVGSHVDGVSLLPVWHGRRPVDWQQAVLIEHHGGRWRADDPDRQDATTGQPPSYEAVRTQQALFVLYGTGDQEYYDTTTDPFERHNLAPRGVPTALPARLFGLVECHGRAQCQQAAG